MADARQNDENVDFDTDKKQKLDAINRFIHLCTGFTTNLVQKLINLKETFQQAEIDQNPFFPLFEDTLELMCDYIKNALVELEALKEYGFKNAAFELMDTSNAIDSQMQSSNCDLTDTTEKLTDNDVPIVKPTAAQKKFNLSLIRKDDTSENTTSLSKKSQKSNKLPSKDKQLNGDNSDSQSEVSTVSIKSQKGDVFNQVAQCDEIDIVEHFLKVENPSQKSNKSDSTDSQSTVLLSECDLDLNNCNDAEQSRMSIVNSDTSTLILERRLPKQDDEASDSTETSSISPASMNSSIDRLNAYCDLKYDSSESIPSSDNSLDLSDESSNVEENNTVNKTLLLEFTRPCFVKLERLNEDMLKHVRKKRMTKDDAELDNLVNRLTNIKTLDNRKTSTSKHTVKKSTEIRKKQKMKIPVFDDSTSDSSSGIHLSEMLDNSSLSLLSDSEDVNLDLKLSSDELSDNSVEQNESKKRKRTAINKDDETTKTGPKETNSWQNDKLLTGKLAISDDSDCDTVCLKTTSNPKKTEDRNKKEAPQCTENDDCDTISSTSSDSDSDCQVVMVKREYSQEDSQAKGRRNIRKVISDDVLQETTKKANKEEEERIARLSQKQKSLENVLSQKRLDSDEIGLVLDIHEETKEPLITAKACLTHILKPHQLKGIKFMWDICFESVKRIQEDDGTGCILAHCMGLGKTMQIVILAYILLTHKITRVNHILIVCPLSTIFNWLQEFEKTLKNVKKIPIMSIKDKDYNKKIERLSQWHNKGGVLLMGYEQFQNLVEPSKKMIAKLTESQTNLIMKALINPGPDLVVCDEGHMLKNGKTLRCKSLKKVNTKRRIILTGTPLQNNLNEYFYMVNFVKPNLLGTFIEYTNRFINPIINGQYEDSGPEDINLMRKRSHILHKKLESTIQRFEVSELQPYLPEKFDYVLFVKLSPLQITLYKKYLEIHCQDYEGGKDLFTNYHNLQYIWTHPALLQSKLNKGKKKIRTYEEDFRIDLDPDSMKDNAKEPDWFKSFYPDDVLTELTYGSKIKILFSIIRECEVIKDKLLVFSSSMVELDLIENFLKMYGTPGSGPWILNKDYYRMDGTVLPQVRTDCCNKFNNDKNTRIKLFLMSHKVGGLGLNLVAANRVVLMDVNWNPSYDIQSIFRVYRFGQTKPCYVYRLISMGTMEEVVYSRAITKLAIAGRVVDEQQISRHFKSNDLQLMYQLNCDYQNPPIQNVPADRLLANLLNTHGNELFKYYEHKSLLENQTHEELTDTDMKVAWEEFHREEQIERMKNVMYNTTFNHPNSNQPSTSQSVNPITEHHNYAQQLEEMYKQIVDNQMAKTASNPVQPAGQTHYLPPNATPLQVDIAKVVGRRQATLQRKYALPPSQQFRLVNKNLMANGNTSIGSNQTISNSSNVAMTPNAIVLQNGDVQDQSNRNLQTNDFARIASTSALNANMQRLSAEFVKLRRVNPNCNSVPPNKIIKLNQNSTLIHTNAHGPLRPIGTNPAQLPQNAAIQMAPPANTNIPNFDYYAEFENRLSSVLGKNGRIDHSVANQVRVPTNSAAAIQSTATAQNNGSASRIENFVRSLSNMNAMARTQPSPCTNNMNRSSNGGEAMDLSAPIVNRPLNNIGRMGSKPLASQPTGNATDLSTATANGQFKTPIKVVRKAAVATSTPNNQRNAVDSSSATPNKKSNLGRILLKPVPPAHNNQARGIPIHKGITKTVRTYENKAAPAQNKPLTSQTKQPLLNPVPQLLQKRLNKPIQPKRVVVDKVPTDGTAVQKGQNGSPDTVIELLASRLKKRENISKLYDCTVTKMPLKESTNKSNLTGTAGALPNADRNATKDGPKADSFQNPNKPDVPNEGNVIVLD